MAMTNNIGAYADIVPILNAALENNGALMEFDERRQAITWRHRANKFRKLAQGMGEEEYNNLVFGLDGSTVVITLRHVVGRLKTLDGTRKLEIDDSVNSAGDELMDFINKGDIA